MAVLNDEQVMLRDMAREWADNESPVTEFRKLRKSGAAEKFDADKWRAHAEMGWAGVIVPEEQGGVGMGWLALGLVLEQLGRTLAASPLAATASAAGAILLSDDEALKGEVLPRIASGEAIATLAIDESPRFDPARCATRVEGGKLNGTKMFVAEGDAATLFVVSAEDGLYLVEDAAGVTKSSRAMVDFRSHADIRFDGSPARKLGGADLINAATDRAAIAVSAEMLGMAEAAFEQTNDYLKTRTQFGQKLSTFQALQHRMAKMFTELQLMRSAVEGGLEALDRGAGVDQAASLAKAVASETLHLVSREMIQLHGGIGMTDEHDAGFYMKRAQVLETMWGTASYHRDRFARLNGY
jgi:alkylation response protein AidB-like acyl-CoA dehydrogenase